MAELIYVLENCGESLMDVYNKGELLKDDDLKNFLISMTKAVGALHKAGIAHT